MWKQPTTNDVYTPHVTELFRQKEKIMEQLYGELVGTPGVHVYVRSLEWELIHKTMFPRDIHRPVITYQDMTYEQHKDWLQLFLQGLHYASYYHQQTAAVHFFKKVALKCEHIEYLCDVDETQPLWSTLIKLMHTLFQEAQGLSKWITAKLCFNNPVREVYHDDILQLSYLYLMQCIRNYHTDLGISFSTFFMNNAPQGVLRDLAEQLNGVHMPEEKRHLFFKISVRFDDYYARHGCDLGSHEREHELKKYGSTLQDFTVYKHLMRPEDIIDKSESLNPTSTSLDEELEQNSQQHHLTEAVSQLPDDLMKIVYVYYYTDALDPSIIQQYQKELQDKFSFHQLKTKKKKALTLLKSLLTSLQDELL